MKKRKLGIIGGSGLYKIEGFEKTKWKKMNTPWGKPSDEILIAKFENEEICFIPRHSRGHKINPTNINFRANLYIFSLIFNFIKFYVYNLSTCFIMLIKF